MALSIDVRFVHSISHLLRNFKKKQDYVWSFACPLCGDSKSKKTKSRGYIYRDPNNFDRLKFKCHNCGTSMTLRTFLKQISEDVFKQYVYESFLDGKDPATPTPPPPKKEPSPEKKREAKINTKLGKTKLSVRPEALVGCLSIASLGEEHPARKYIVERKIPKPFWRQLFWTDDFAATAQKICAAHTLKLKTEGRILIPLMDNQGRFFGVQGRSIDPNTSLRYITIKTNENAPKIYGMHRLGLVVKRVYIVEGPFDSMFLPDCLAMTGSDIPKSLPMDRTVVVYDNEPRSDAICKKMEAAIEKGYRVVIWPRGVGQTTSFDYKDINAMVMAGYSPAAIRTIIDNNSFSGLEAKVKFAAWKKPQAPKKQERSND